MPSPVTLVTVHHEGGGSPTTGSGCSRFAHGGYTYGIGTDGWNRFRDVWSSYATLNYNHVSLDLCLPGNRMDYVVTDHDLEVIRSACQNARELGYVVSNPTVRAHQNSPGSSTACPGTHTMARWNEVAAACTSAGAPPTSPPTAPQTGGAPLTTVASPKGAQGRVGTARPIPAFGTVALDNGASLQGDVASGTGRVWVNPDRTVQDLHAPLLDIAATVDGHGRPDGRGIVALYDLGNGSIGTYVVPWS